MKQPIFVMERWQSHHENAVEYNLAESGVQPVTLAELQELTGLDPADTLLGYGHTDGSPSLRQRIAALYPGATADNIVATVGSAEANFLAMWRLVEQGDRVVVVRPTYEQTTGLAVGLGAQLDSVWLEEDRGWQPVPGAATEAIQPGTRLVVVTNPNNPTGHPLGEAAIAEIVEAAGRTGAWILSDEVYAGGELSGEPTPSFWGRTDRVLVSASLSKAYGLPGLRLGWLVVPAEFREIGEKVPLPDGGVVTHFPLQHPGGALGYRLDWPGRSLAYVTDTTAKADADYLPHIRGVDVLIHECYFTDEHRDWAAQTGHSCATAVVELARAADVGRLLLVHINPLVTDDRLYDLDRMRSIFEHTEIGTDRMTIDF